MQTLLLRSAQCSTSFRKIHARTPRSPLSIAPRGKSRNGRTFGFRLPTRWRERSARLAFGYCTAGFDSRARRDQTRAAVEAAIEKIDRDIQSTGDTVSGKWNALRAKLIADKDAFKAAVAQRRHDVSVRRAEDDAELLEYEATCSVDYAIAAIEQAKLAVLDAIAGRIEAQGAKAS